MEILPKAQQKLWPQLKPSIDLGLVLYGGTAIALRLGHRSSVDFDFFTDRPLNKERLKSAFPFIERSTVLQEQPNTLTVLVGHIKISYFGEITFGRVGLPENTQDGVLQVASMDDLMATKLKVILQRSEAKDYRDIVALLKAKISLSKGLASARAMYGKNFQPSEGLKALVYFGDGDLNALSQAEKNLLIGAASRVRSLPRVKIQSHGLLGGS
ncbi:MAG: nucleotidyl transferase AbiEii/AbiGii toxin family protein [Deltaproteobacteria bacterium]|nr:nucleotidyl transferase AbiEii/AbiGii toxin family protein [Deltaproteobacteria bacterium]